MDRKDSFLINRLKSIKYAFRGALILLKTEASIKIQLIVASLITVLGFYFNLSSTEWILQLLAIGFVLSIEGLNTAVEALANFVHPEYHHKIGLTKDIAAGAVLVASIFAGIIGLIIYVPKML